MIASFDRLARGAYADVEHHRVLPDRVRVRQPEWQAAVEALRSGEPLRPRGTNMLGRALMQLGDKEAARHAFERTLAVEPDNKIALRQLEALQS